MITSLDIPRTTEACSGCGLILDGGAAACERLFQGLVGRDFSDVTYGRVHRMLVDTYCLQHPDTYCASAKSLAAHLTGLCWILEHGGDRANGGEALRRWLDGRVALERPEVPAFRGLVTIAAVLEAEGPAAHVRAVEAWARSSWEAYAPLHALAREWVAQALARSAGSGPRKRHA